MRRRFDLEQGDGVLHFGLGRVVVIPGPTEGRSPESITTIGS